MRYYCTYFDRNYLIHGVTLWRSLQRHAAPCHLYVLCFDDFTFETLSSLGEPTLIPVALADFERGDEALLAAKPTRSKVEYFFTCTPSWPLYILNHFPEVDLITYLDADLWFYSSPEPLFEELGPNAIAIIGHRYPERTRELEKFGVYNVSWLSFRRDPRAIECLRWWRERCLEWCRDEPEDGKFGDQKYLDDWPTRFQGVTVLQHPGAGLAPWNWMNQPAEKRAGKLFADGKPLIFYHYQGLKFFNSWLYDPVAEGRGYGEMPLRLRWRLYHPYVQALKESARWLRRSQPQCRLVYTRLRTGAYGWRKWLRKIAEARLMFNSGIR